MVMPYVLFTSLKFPLIGQDILDCWVNLWGDKNKKERVSLPGSLSFKSELDYF
jgi:hypothetical protein